MKSSFVWKRRIACVTRVTAHHVALMAIVALGCSRSTEARTVNVPEASTEPSPAAPLTSPVSETERKHVLDALPPLINAHYVFPDIGTQTIASIREHVDHGDYAALADGEQFASAITRDLRAVSHDKHFALRYAGGQADNGLSREEEEEHRRVLASLGFVSIARLPGNIASLRIDCFDRSPDEPAVADAYAKRMTEVADASALILDLRENHGGDPMTVALLVSYLEGPSKILINDFWDRDDGSTWHSYTRPNVPGQKFGATKPLFVLTSKRTFSGGEEAAYDLQALKRATILGETTGGAANPAPRHKVSPHFVLAVPSVRVTNAVTHANWEGVGVIPDVPIAAEDAMHEAQIRAISALIVQNAAGPARTELERELAHLKETPVTTPR